MTGSPKLLSFIERRNIAVDLEQRRGLCRGVFSSPTELFYLSMTDIQLRELDRTCQMDVNDVHRRQKDGVGSFPEGL